MTEARKARPSNALRRIPARAPGAQMEAALVAGRPASFPSFSLLAMPFHISQA